MIYHSALKAINKDVVNDPVERAEFRNMLVFRHDITLGKIPDEYNKCDLIYIEPSWKLGQEEFNRRVGKIGNDFDIFLNSVIHYIDYFYNKNIPVVLTGGEIYKKSIKFDKIYKIKLNGYPCYLLVVGDLMINNHNTQIDVQEELANRFNLVGDFCCGYGNVGMRFALKRKGFVMSDYNAKCIGYIKENMKKWYENI